MLTVPVNDSQGDEDIDERCNKFQTDQCVLVNFQMLPIYQVQPAGDYEKEEERNEVQERIYQGFSWHSR